MLTIIVAWALLGLPFSGSAPPDPIDVVAFTPFPSPDERTSLSWEHLRVEVSALGEQPRSLNMITAPPKARDYII